MFLEYCLVFVYSACKPREKRDILTFSGCISSKYFKNNDLFIYLFLFYMHICLPEYLYVYMCADVLRGQKIDLDLLEL